MTRSEEILCKIASLKDSIEASEKEVETLKKELKRISQNEAERMMRERKRRANRMAYFINHNSSRTIVVKCTMPEFNGGEYLGETDKEFICKPGEYNLFKSQTDDWVIEKPNEFGMLLECVDNIYVEFE